MFEFEKKKLLNYINNEAILNILKEEKCFIAGGCITSLFTRREINDVDIYFRSKESLVNALQEIVDDGCYVMAHTNKATMFVVDNSENKYQFIHFKYFEKAEDIFDTFDFTACMGAYDFEKEEFILHSSFLAHNAQRLLKINEKTAYPIVTALRIQKYLDKGYSISKPEFIKIMLVINQLKINTYKELKEQMGGMYGINYDNMFTDIMDDEKFDINVVIEKLSDLILDDDYFNIPINKDSDELRNVKEFINSIYIDGDYKIYKKRINTGYYGLSKNEYIIIKGKIIIDILDECEIKVKEDRLSTDECIVEVYKNVKLKDDNSLVSFWKESFKYELLTEVVSNNDKGLYFSKSIADCKTDIYGNEKDKVIIKCLANINDIVGDIQFKKCIPLEIVEDIDK